MLEDPTSTFKIKLDFSLDSHKLPSWSSWVSPDSFSDEVSLKNQPLKMS